jgi:hypothetical protein
MASLRSPSPPSPPSASRRWCSARWLAAAADAAPAVEEVRLENEAKAITARLLAVRETVSELISEAKRLEKKAAKIQKIADKRRRRRAPVEGEEGKPARVSIFQQPVDISPALCSFLGRPTGSQESRSNVTKFITSYVKEHNLKNKHEINADAKLRNLLGLKEGASADDVRAAHRRLMKAAHPDLGGTDYLAAKINEAKEFLLQDGP